MEEGARVLRGGAAQEGKYLIKALQARFLEPGLILPTFFQNSSENTEHNHVGAHVTTINNYHPRRSINTIT